LSGKVLFNLAQWWPPGAPRKDQVELYEEIKAGRKTSEFRDPTDHWLSRLYTKEDKDGVIKPKVDRAWFVVGFPKGSVPRLEADITNIILHADEMGYAYQIEIQFENVVEVLK